MRLRELFLRELQFRPVGFLLGLVAVTVAVASLVGTRAFLAAHDEETGVLIQALERRASTRMNGLREEARVFAKSLGFNILLLPGEQDASEFLARDESRHFLTRAQVRTLGEARLRTLNHLLPILRQRIRQGEGEIVLVGIEGEIYIKSPGFQRPIREPIAPGTVHLGHALPGRFGVAAGERIEIRGESFEIRRLLPPQGSVDDVTVLLNLADAQRLLDRGGLVSGVLALSCSCTAGELEPIRQEVHRLLPGAQVIESSDRARARLRARRAVDKTGTAEVQDIAASRAALRAQVTTFALLLVALLAIVAVVLLAVLTAASARERRLEVAMLRALGLSTLDVLGLFLAKAALTGLMGGVLGGAAGLLAGRVAAGAHATASPSFLVAVGLGAALVSVIACALPSLAIAREDPAVVLNRG